MSFSLKTTIELAKIEFISKYSQSTFGFLWHLLMPVINYCTIIGVFKYIIYPDKPNWFYSHILAGLIIWNCFRDITTSSCSIFIFKWSKVKEMNISLLSVVISNHLSQFITFLIHFTLYLLFIYLMVPTVMDPIMVITSFISFFLMTIFVGLLLSVLGALYNDIYYLWSAIGTLLFWSLPILYLPDQVPLKLQKFLLISPFYFPFLSFKQAIIGQKINYFTQIFAIFLSFLLIYLTTILIKKNKNRIINSL